MTSSFAVLMSLTIMITHNNPKDMLIVLEPRKLWFFQLDLYQVGLGYDGSNGLSWSTNRTHSDLGESVLNEVEHLPVRPEVPHGERLTGSLLGLALWLFLQVVFLSHCLHLQVKEEIHTFLSNCTGASTGRLLYGSKSESSHNTWTTWT